MNRYKSAAVGFFVLGIIGCAGIPAELKYTGATPLQECPEDLDISLSNDEGAILTSIVVHTINRNTWDFLLKEEATRSKYLMSLEPRSFGIHKEGLFSYKSKSRSHCYLVQPGRYQFVKAYTYTVNNGVGRGGGISVSYSKHGLTKGFQVQAGKVSYIGQLFIEDPRLKGKGYFGHMLASFLALLAREEMEINSIDESDDDMSWLEENTKTSKTSVVNAVEF